MRFRNLIVAFALVVCSHPASAQEATPDDAKPRKAWHIQSLVIPGGSDREVANAVSGVLADGEVVNGKFTPSGPMTTFMLDLIKSRMTLQDRGYNFDDIESGLLMVDAIGLKHKLVVTMIWWDSENNPEYDSQKTPVVQSVVFHDNQLSWTGSIGDKTSEYALDWSQDKSVFTVNGLKAEFPEYRILMISRSIGVLLEYLTDSVRWWHRQDTNSRLKGPVKVAQF